MTARAPVGAIVLVALGATAALLAMGGSELSSPPLGSWSDLEAWYAEREALTAVVALVWLLGMGAGAWLVVAGSLQLVASVIGRGRFSAAVDRISPPFLRVLGSGVAGLSVTAGLTLPALPAGADENPRGTAVMVPLDVAAPATTTTAPPATVPPTTATTSTIPPAPPLETPPASLPAPPPRSHEVVVAAGDSFWSIAVEEAGDHDLDEYWRALIDLNRDRLVDPSNPDLLYPAQVLRLP